MRSGSNSLQRIQINPNREELRSEEAHCPRIPGASWQLTRQPPLPLTRIIVTQDICGSGMPANTESVAQFQAHLRIAQNVTNVACPVTVFRHDPELLAH